MGGRPEALETVQVVEAVDNSDVLDDAGQPAYSLRSGGRYVLHDREAGCGLRDGAVKLLGDVDRSLAMYNREPLDAERIFLPFIGRQGDALVAASCIAALLREYPNSRVDIACLPIARCALELIPEAGRLVPYPLEADRLANYDYYLSFEDIDAVRDGSRRTHGDVFSACLHTPRPTEPARAVVPGAARNRWALPEVDRPRVALHAGRVGNLRSYPHDLLVELMHQLIKLDMDVYVFGEGVSPGELTAQTSNRLHDLIGATETPADLAAVLDQMDAVVTGDSFPLHLAASLGVPAIAMFTSTDGITASDYAQITRVQSRAACSPCFVAEGPCPEGHSQCGAHRHASLSPASIAERVREAIASAPGVCG